jgi:ABC-type transport system involved in multi-copper enzyme maturation permease subunit
MILTQTKALFVDAYRDLNARKMFWVVLTLNALAIGAFGMLGIDGGQLKLLNWKIPLEEFTLGLPLAPFIYRWIFSYFVVGKWLTWIATILALISTASIFPDFMAGGAIDLYLSKPVGRLRLFLTKYATGLLFVALQVTIFTLGSFLVLGLRGGTWEPGLFLAIPIVVLFFSYLFSICVFFGVLTRSTLAAFFLTLIAWFMIFGLNTGDRFLVKVDDHYRDQAQRVSRQLAGVNQQIQTVQRRLDHAATQPSAGSLDPGKPSPDSMQLQRLQAERARLQANARDRQPPAWLYEAQRVVFALDTLVPKTQETIDLLDRVLFDDVVLQTVMNLPDEGPRPRGPMHGWRGQIRNMLHARSLWWILGSSIAFEAIVLSLASWRFCRRDY